MEKILDEIAHWIGRQEQKVVIGISGHGASGKTTFANKLVKLIGPQNVNAINTDPYIVDSHLRKHAFINYEYNNENHHAKMTACHPSAHHLLALERDIRMVKEGLDFYTIDTHYNESTLITSQNKVTIIEGMSVAFINAKSFNLSVYFYTDEETEFMRRSIRDISERGMDIDYLKKTHEERRIQYELFMHPHHRNFDVVIKNSNDEFIVERCEKLGLMEGY